MATDTPPAPAIVWLRNDLRIEDNPALHAARESGAPVIPLYILDEKIDHAPGAASLWWLHHSLSALGADLKKAGTSLILHRGDSAKMLKDVIAESGADAVFWNRRYFEAHIEIDKELKKSLEEDGLFVKSFSANLLREPWELETKTGGYYKVYSPFWRSMQKERPNRSAPLPRLRTIEGPKRAPKSDKLGDWKLLPTRPDWAGGIAKTWTPGEQGARDRLNEFLRGPIDEYAEGRNRPDKEYTSRLSPHLAFGEISPLKIWAETKARMDAGDVQTKAAEKFLSEIAWREFAYVLLYHNPDLPDAPLRKQFEDYPWRNDPQQLVAWQKGMTGYPIVDAGMRQLWQTGWMHNRVRMIVASFLIKHLLIHWREGEAWFWDTLVDADLANNSASWQWVAGSGADASPYFRIFNPITQGEKFDPNGDYIREFVPELKKLPNKHIFSPWTASRESLKEAGVTLGDIYPEPIVDHSEARKRALAGYEKIKGG